MKTIPNRVIECQYGKKVCTDTIRFKSSMFDDNIERIMKFDIYDGFAYCESYHGKEYIITYPKYDFVVSCPTMAKTIKEEMFMLEDGKIIITDILQVYGSLYEVVDNIPNNLISMVLNPSNDTNTYEVKNECQIIKFTPNN